MIKNVIVIVLAILIILFVLVPLSFMALGKIENPFAIEPISAFADKSELDKNKPNCNNPTESLESHTRDATLGREDESSIVESIFYKLRIDLEDTVVDWQYTEGALDDEVASFIYKDTMVNILARSSIAECNRNSQSIFEDFHEKTSGIEYFSSHVYQNQGAPIGLTKSTLRNHSEGKVGGVHYYWYLLDEEFQNRPDLPLVTIWYSTRVGRVEYWYAFRVLKENEDRLNKVAEEVLESVEYKKF